MTVLRRMGEKLSAQNLRLATANVAVALLGLITGVIAARSLGPAQRGDLAVITFWPALIAALVDLTVADTVMIRTAARSAKPDEALGDGAVIAFALSSFGVGAGAIALPWLLTGDQAHLLRSATGYLLFIPLALLGTPIIGSLLGAKSYGAYAAVRVLTTLTYVLVLVVLVAGGWASPTSIAAGSLVAPIFVIIGGLLMLRRAGTLPNLSVRMPGLIEQVRTGVRLHPVRVVALAAAMVDRALANRSLASGLIGLYQVPVAIRLLAPTVAQGLTQGLMPELASVPKAERAALVCRALGRAMGWTTVLVAVGIPMLPLLIPAIFGAPFAGAVAATSIMALAGIIEAGVVVLQGVARTLLFVRLGFAAEAVSFTVSIAIGPWMARHLGIAGLATAYGVGRALALTVLVRGMHYGVEVSSRDLTVAVAREIASIGGRSARHFGHWLRSVLAGSSGP